MRIVKFFLINALAALSACVSSGPVRTAPMDLVTEVEYSQPHGFLGLTRQHLNLVILNNCSARIETESFDHTERSIVRIPWSRSKSVRLKRPFLNGNTGSFEVVVIVSAYDAQGKYLGSATRRFSIDYFSSGNQEPWVVDYLDSPSGAACIGQR